MANRLTPGCSMQTAGQIAKPPRIIFRLFFNGTSEFEGNVMSNSLWPNFSTVSSSRGLREMLYDAAGDIDTQTNGAIQFYLDTLGVSGTVKHVRHNCYLRVPKTGYTHLLFQVTTTVPGPWPATVSTPEGEKIPRYSRRNSTARRNQADSTACAHEGNCPFPFDHSEVTVPNAAELRRI